MPSPFLFSNPGEVELVCFDNADDAAERDAVALPWACCLTDRAIEGCPEQATPVRHALVTQTARGEVASVDIENGRILDSERRVPGYTFVDVGGLPAAIVVPPKLPHSEALQGPAWTYIAGREANSVRAIATCRFQQGRACGPEQGIAGDDAAFREQTEVPLPEAPEDMLLDPNGNALWLSLPEAGLIARIELGDADLSSERCADQPGLGSCRHPFALGDDGKPAPPSYFVVPSGLTDVAPPEPVAEATSYLAVCGMGYDFAPTKLQLPMAERATSTGRAVPTRMRLLLPSADASLTQPLLLVADVGQMVLHAFAIVPVPGEEDPELAARSELEQRAALLVGAPVRDFAVTPAVPAAAPSFEALVNPSEFAYAEPPADEQRYLYAIDARDGSLMLFDMSFDGETPALTPLDAPVPARQENDVRRNARDRLFFDGAAARALDVIDTRQPGGLSPEQELYRDPLYCGKEPLKGDQGLEQELRRKRAELGGNAPEVRALDETIKLTKAAKADVLSGVFVIVAAGDGRISVLDVHDLNLQCRARAACFPGDDATPANARDKAEDSNEPALAVRRHAPRLLTANTAFSLVSSRNQLGTFDMDAGAPEDEGGVADAGDGVLGCPGGPEGYYRPTDESPMCVVADPWQARDLGWAVRYQDTITTVYSAVLEVAPDAEQVTLWGPQGFDFCARGANAEDGLRVAITSAPEPGVRGCRTPTAGREPLLHVAQAYHDRLVLTPERIAPDAGVEPAPEPDPDAPADEPDGGTETPEAEPDAGVAVDLDELARCYPEFVQADLRLYDQYRVAYSSGVYLHRNRAGDDGVCVMDETIDRRFTSRVSGPDWLFEDLWLTFKLDVPASDREEISPVVELNRQSSFLAVSNVDSSSGRADALPSRVRYFPDTGDLFIVDSASQGLRRYLLDPFRADDTRFR